MASSPVAWTRRNVRQPVSTPRGGGPVRAAARIRRIVPAPTRWPSPTSSPWMRRCPHPGFSWASRRTRFRNSSLIDGRPGRVRIRPVPLDQAAVPGQQRGRGDDLTFPQLARQGTDQCGQHRAIWPRQARPSDLASQHSDLVVQLQQLGDHRGLAARHLRQQAEHSNRGQVQQANNRAPIRRDRHKTPVHTLCEQFWHGTR